MQQLSRRFFVGTLIASLALTAVGASPRMAQAGTLPGFPFPVTGISTQQLIKLAQKNPKVVANIIKKVSSFYSSGGKITSASFDPTTGVLLIFWKTKKGVARVTDDFFTKGLNGSSQNGQT